MASTSRETSGGLSSTKSTLLMSKEKFTYAVIEFEINHETYISACPMEWITEDSCVWPSRTGIERKAISTCMKPESDWINIENIIILGKYSTYKEALYNEKKKSITSDESDIDQRKRKVKKNMKYRDDSISPPPTASDESAEISSLSVTENSSEDELHMMLKTKTPITEKRNNLDKSKSSLHKRQVKQNENETFESQVNDGLENYRKSPEREEDRTLVFDINNDIIIGEKTIDDLWHLLQGIKTQLSIITERMNNMERMLATPGHINKPVVQLPKLPLESVAELQTLEEELHHKTELEDCLINYLQFIGGSDGRVCIFRVCEKIFTNYLAQFCSWTGKGGNFQLSNLKIIQILKKAVKVTFPLTTDHTFETVVMAWFNHGKTRYSREKKIE